MGVANVNVTYPDPEVEVEEPINVFTSTATTGLDELQEALLVPSPEYIDKTPLSTPHVFKVIDAILWLRSGLILITTRPTSKMGKAEVGLL
jgi:hypothetical protein